MQTETAGDIRSEKTGCHDEADQCQDRRIKTGGDVRAALALIPVTRPVFDRYTALGSENPAKAAELGRQRAAAEAALEAAEQEWLEATEAYEAMKGEG